MITPNKYTDLDSSILNISAEIIKVLKENKVLKYDDLFSYVINKIGDNSKEVFIHSLGFLFAINTITYHQSEDVIEIYETK